MSNLVINDAGDVLEFDGQQWKPARMAQNDAGEKVVFDGSAWKPLGTLVGSAKGRGDAANKSDGVAQAFGQGATLGFGDELTAGVRAAMPGFSNWMMSGPALPRDESIGGRPTPQTVSTAPTFQGRYDEELARERAKAQQFHKENPALATGANIGGSVATTALALPSALVSGGGLLANTVRGAALGGTLGGAQGFGEGEGGLTNRASNAIPGAVAGAVVGGALPAVGAAAKYIYQKAAPPVLNAAANIAERFTPKVSPGSLSAAAPEGGQIVGDSLATRLADTARIASGNIEGDAATSRLALELSRSGGTRQAGQRLADLGEGAFIADTSKGAQRLANVGNIMPGDAADKYAAAFGQRNRETGQRFLNAMGDNANVPSIHDTRRFLEARRTHEAGELYRRAADQGLTISPELGRLLDENQIVRQAFDRVTRENMATRVGTDRAAIDPVTLMHQTKEAIVDIATAATTGGNPTQRAYRDLADDFVRAFKDANPAVRAADARYREMKSLYDNVSGEGWLTHGQNFMRKGTGEAAVEVSPAALADYIPRMTAEQMLTFRAGASNVIRDAAMSGPDSTRRLAKSIADNEMLQQKLSQTYGPAQAQRLIKQSNTERTFAETGNKVLHGSDTAQRMASLADEAALTLPHGGGSPAGIVQMLLEQYAKVRQPSEAVRSRLADMLANPNSAANAETLSLVEALLKRQAAARSYSSGLAGGAGGSFASNP